MIFPIVFGFDERNKLTDELPRFSEYAYDFDKNNFKYKNGRHYLVYDNEALKIWIYKTLKTRRNYYIAYTSDFGNEIHNLIGSTVSNAVKKEELKRYIIECLMVNPYIKSISNIVIKKEEDVYIIDIFISSIYADKIEEMRCEIDWI